jgi:2-polyprenyl-3-methyl-5-hydroxy-6-metoxy-1,4-benzoquinol methylase
LRNVKSKLLEGRLPLRLNPVVADRKRIELAYPDTHSLERMTLHDIGRPSGIMTPGGIDYFNRGHWLTAVQERVSLAARQRMFELWRSWRKRHQLPAATILDIGATPDTERMDSNCFLRWFHDEGLDIHCYSPEPIQRLTEAYPYIHVIESAEHSTTKVPSWPVPAHSFDWSASSAVLEHVGSRAQQVAFIAEHARVARALFLTTPNRAHWLEFHTKLPFLHWLPRHFHRRALQAVGESFWAEENNLRLVTKAELLELARGALGREGQDFQYAVQTIWTLGMPSNLVLLGHRLDSRAS